MSDEISPPGPMGTTERWTLAALVVGWFVLFAASGKPVGTTLWSASVMEGVSTYEGAESWAHLAVSFALFVPLALVTAQVVRRARSLVTATFATLPAAALFVMLLVLGDMIRARAAEASPYVAQVAFGFLLFAIPVASLVTLPFGWVVALLLRWARRRDDARAR